MTYHSHIHSDVTHEFSDALLASLAPDGGLWMPEMVPSFTPEQTALLGAMSFADCAAELAKYFTDDNFTEDDLKDICRDAYDFPVPLKTLDGQTLDSATPEHGREYILELFHGPYSGLQRLCGPLHGQVHVSHYEENRRDPDNPCGDIRRYRRRNR